MKRKYRKGRITQIISTRIENETAQLIRDKAKEKGVGYTVLLRDIILQGLEAA